MTATPSIAAGRSSHGPLHLTSRCGILATAFTMPCPVSHGLLLVTICTSKQGQQQQQFIQRTDHNSLCRAAEDVDVACKIVHMQHLACA